MTMAGIYVYICAVYLISLRSIKKAIKRLESKNEKDGLLQNKCLVRAYFLIYIVNLLICMSLLMIILPHRSNFEKKTLGRQACQ